MHPGLGHSMQRSASWCRLGWEAEVHFLKVVGADLRELLRHALAWQLGAFFVGQRIVAGFVERIRHRAVR